MNMLSVDVLLPYVTLGLLIAGLFFIQSRKTIAVLLAAQIVLAFVYKIIDPIGLLSVAVFWGICTRHWRHPSSKEWFNSLRLWTIIIIALCFARHIVPGFHNLRVFTDLRMSAFSSPFTMYLNFDKTIAAVILAVAAGVLFKQTGSFGKKSFTETLKVSAFCIAILIPLAILSGYVNFDPKFPESFGLWAFNNLIFVCFAEEIIFRGVIQNHLVQVASRCQISPFIPIFISAILFGFGHFQGGPIYIAFAAISGLFYGYAYYKTNRLESAILVHFIVNLCHFLLFSYPMAASLAK